MIFLNSAKNNFVKKVVVSGEKGIRLVKHCILTCTYKYHFLLPLFGTDFDKIDVFFSSAVNVIKLVSAVGKRRIQLFTSLFSIIRLLKYKCYKSWNRHLSVIPETIL